MVITYSTIGTCQSFNIVQFMIEDKPVWLTCKRYLLCMFSQPPVLFEALLFDIDLHVSALPLLNIFTNETMFKLSSNLFFCVKNFVTTAVTRLALVVFVVHIQQHYYLQWFSFLSSFACGQFSCFNSRTDSNDICTASIELH